MYYRCNGSCGVMERKESVDGRQDLTREIPRSHVVLLCQGGNLRDSLGVLCLAFGPHRSYKSIKCASRTAWRSIMDFGAACQCQALFGKAQRLHTAPLRTFWPCDSSQLRLSSTNSSARPPQESSKSSAPSGESTGAPLAGIGASGALRLPSR